MQTFCGILAAPAVSRVPAKGKTQLADKRLIQKYDKQIAVYFVIKDRFYDNGIAGR
jgi:hypothetical protein